MESPTPQSWNDYYAKGQDFGLITSQLLTDILNLVDSTITKTHLDIGCGMGQLTRELYHKGYTSIGIDISDVAIEKAKENTVYYDSLIYITGDIESLDLQLPHKATRLSPAGLCMCSSTTKKVF